MLLTDIEPKGHCRKIIIIITRPMQPKSNHAKEKKINRKQPKHQHHQYPAPYNSLFLYNNIVLVKQNIVLHVLEWVKKT